MRKIVQFVGNAAVRATETGSSFTTTCVRCGVYTGAVYTVYKILVCTLYGANRS